MKDLRSHFKEHIKNMLEYKQALGFCKDSYEYHLHQFDKYCYIQFPNEIILTKDLVLTWARKKDSESGNGFRRRIAVIREFAKYLQSVGAEAYIFPYKMTSSQEQYIPHIFTDSELASFFHGADNFKELVCDPLGHYIVPVIFRLMYCCGLRPFEARLIKTADINLETGRLHLHKTKRHKERVIMLSNDLLTICRRYIVKLTKLYGETMYLFPTSNGSVRSKQWLTYQFHKCFRIAGIYEFTSPKPRPYDFRHTFATKCLYRWMEQGEDLYFWLPYLSAFMGHSDFSSTAYYIHLLPERLINTQAIDWKAFADLIPEVAE